MDTPSFRLCFPFSAEIVYCYPRTREPFICPYWRHQITFSVGFVIATRSKESKVSAVPAGLCVLVGGGCVHDLNPFYLWGGRRIWLWLHIVCFFSLPILRILNNTILFLFFTVYTYIQVRKVKRNVCLWKLFLILEKFALFFFMVIFCGFRW